MNTNEFLSKLNDRLYFLPKKEADNLLDYYKENGEKRQMRRLYGLMKRVVARTENITDEERKRYNDEIDR